jgi:hypothetical protein
MQPSSIWEILPAEIARPSLENDTFWNRYQWEAAGASIHVAILSNSYLELILNYCKTVESRFSVQKRTPYKRVKKGDIILLKQSGGPIKGISYVSSVWFYEITPGTLDQIKKRFASQLQIKDQTFWHKYEKSSYATLIQLEHVRRLNPIKYSKRDQRAWVSFNSPYQLPLEI